MLTFAGFLARDALGPEALVQDVQHLPAQVEEQQRQRPHRHGDRLSRRRRRRCRATKEPIGRRRLGREGALRRGSSPGCMGCGA